MNKYRKWKRVTYTDSNGKERIKIVSEERGNMEGFRFINLECLSSFVNSLTIHALECKKAQELYAENGESPIVVLGEVWSRSLASIVGCRCKGCGKNYEIKSPRMRHSKRFEINFRAVWAQMVTGGGSAKLSEQCTTMGIPGMTSSTFSAIEEEIGDLWKQV